ncbi:GntR family transcriptional regulator (plasmid) [Sinorhizobium chiapasense]|uniref:GntR family transcriptional regulator n=1 Tax=Sinorhizobium chiapasense TaxID=501572 RepID=UPI002FDF4001
MTAVEADAEPLTAKMAARIRTMLIEGRLAPGEKLSEQQIAADLEISRNTLREVFRLLASQGLLTHIPNRGVFVVAPDEAMVMDIYRVRRVIQKAAVQAASPGHPALARMGALADEADAATKAGDWKRVGAINLEFHRAMVELCDSPKLSECFDQVLAELRLVFHQLEDTAYLHQLSIERNTSLVTLLQVENIGEATHQLEADLLKSERAVLAGLQRRKNGNKSERACLDSIGRSSTRKA